MYRVPVQSKTSYFFLVTVETSSIRPSEFWVGKPPMPRSVAGMAQLKDEVSFKLTSFLGIP